MRFRLGAALLSASTLLAGCSDGETASSESAAELAALDTDDQKASYGIGMNMGGQLADARDRLDRAALMRGIEDALQGNEPALPGEEIDAALQAFGEEIEAVAAEERMRTAEENIAAGEAYLAENGAREGVITAASGLQYEVLRQGDGERPVIENSVRLHYRGTLIDGTEFDSSYERGQPVVFEAGGLIAGFTQALLLMPVGSHYRIVIPAEIAYGPGGSGSITPNSTLIFEIELLEIVDGG